MSGICQLIHSSGLWYASALHQTHAKSCPVITNHISEVKTKHIYRSNTEVHLLTAACQLRTCRMLLLLSEADARASRSARKYRCILVIAEVTALCELASWTAWTQSCKPDRMWLVRNTTAWDSDSTRSLWNLENERFPYNDLSKTSLNQKYTLVNLTHSGTSLLKPLRCSNSPSIPEFHALFQVICSASHAGFRLARSL